MILGLTGTYCSGKDTVAAYLVNKKGYTHYSLSDELRIELGARGVSATRENLIAIGTELRQNEGNAVLARRVLAHCGEGKRYVVTSVRHPAEIEELQGRRGFHLVTLDAPSGTRFERMRLRNRHGDPETYERFVELEGRESQDAGSGQQLDRCRKEAKIVLRNDGTLEELYRRVDALLAQLAAVDR